MDYTLVDDSHFLTAGFEPEQLFGYYVSEDRGVKVRVIPGLQSLRYLVPFREVGDVIAFLRDSAGSRHPGGMAAMGDDLEKFGAWPGTYDHCYTNGWLERFFAALESESAWLETSLPGEYLASHAALGRADLPTASYTEMMEWVLPTDVRQQFHEVRERFAGEPDVQRFLRGGFWRGFFTKYAESNLLNKKMMRAAHEIERLGHRRRTPSALRKLAEAHTLVLNAQCNDAYWHGVFGGLYSPHLRTALWSALIRAEALMASIESPRRRTPHAERLDLDCDGAEEVLVEAPQFSALIKALRWRHHRRARRPPLRRDAGEFADAPPGGLSRATARGLDAIRRARRLDPRSIACEGSGAGAAPAHRSLAAPRISPVAFRAGKALSRIATRFALKKMPPSPAALTRSRKPKRAA